MSFGFIANLARQIGYNPDGRRFTNSTTTQDAITDIDNALSGTDNMISDAWNSSTTYSVGKYCIYNNCLWQCLVQNTNTTPSEGTYWTKVSVTNKLVNLIKTETTTKTVQLGSTYVNTDFAPTQVSGYKCIGILGYALDGSYNQDTIIYRATMNASTGNYKFSLYNTKGTTYDCTLSVLGLYIKI